MKQPSPAHNNRRPAAALAALALLTVGLLAAPPASAAYEQVGCFAGTDPANACAPVKEEKFGEEVQLGGIGGIAVNVKGVGGVPAGTVYAASKSGGERWVSMYEPAGEGLKFVERWVVSAEGAYERCGPLLGVNGEGKAEVPCASRPKGGHGWVDAEVDQETGNVFVFGGFTNVFGGGGENEVVEYSPDGAKEITSFAPEAPSGKTVAETPAAVHFTSPELGPLAINSTGAGGLPKGTVYLADEAQGTYHRLMVFEPQSPGDYEHYVYAGEVLAGSAGAPLWGPVTDAAGNLYLYNSEEKVMEFPPEAPAAYPAPAASPTCTYNFAPKGIVGLTVNPATGEPFFFSYKKPKLVRRLGPCDPQTHQFTEAAEPETIAVAPERDDLDALGFDPTRKLPGRPAGVLYGGAPSPEPATGVGKGEPGQSALGYIFAAPKEDPPTIEAESVSRVGARSAQLHATLDPQGFETHYAFQYESEAQYEANPPGERFAGAGEAPPGGGVEKGAGPRGIGIALTGLAPDGGYLYRVVATSHCAAKEPAKVCETDGAAQEFHTYPEGPYPLPDHRAWELVSPTQKNGGQVVPADPGIASCPSECKPGYSFGRFPLQSSAEGNAIAYEGGPFGEEGAMVENEYLARRSEAGWQSTNLTPPALLREGGTDGYKFLSADLGTALLTQQSPRLSPEAPEGYRDLYAQPSADPSSLTPLLSEAPPTRSAAEFHLGYAGASEDGSRVFFAANDALIEEEVTGIAPAAPPVSASQEDLYEWHQGQLALVNVLPGNASAAPGSFATTSAQAISGDGSRAFWSSEAGQLYVRIDGEETQQVSETQRAVADPLGTQPATFLGASADGSRALFSSSEELTEDSNTGLGQEILINATAGTFTLSFAAQSTTPLPFDVNTTTEREKAAAEVQSALEALPSIGKGNVTVADGKEGLVVTFTGALATNAEPLGVDGSGLIGTVSLRSFRAGKDLYEWHEGTLTDLTAGQGSYALQGIVGTSSDLSRLYFADTAVLDGKANAEGDFAEAGKDNLYAFSQGSGVRFVAQLEDHGHTVSNVRVNDFDARPAYRTAEASPDGRYLAFLSAAPLTGYDNVGPCAVNVTYSQTPCPEAFLYDAQSEALICASCNRSGSAPLGWSVLRTRAGASQPRYLTNAGRLFFDSEDSLSPADSNEGAEDVYEYEPSAVGSCEREGGCVSLISAGHEAADSNFLAMDESGANVFFTTRDQLVLKDKDELIDLYDAREGGGIPAESESEPVPCQGEACLPQATPPNDPTPGSSSFEGAGNVVEEKTHKHKKKRHAKHKHAKKRHVKHNRGGAK